MHKTLVIGAVLLALSLGPAGLAHAGSSGNAALSGALGAAAGSSHHHRERGVYYVGPAGPVYVVPAGRGWGPPHKHWHKHKYKWHD